MLRKSLLTVSLAMIVFTTGWTVAGPLTSSVEHQAVQLPVLKVFTAKDGEAAFRAYLVKWKDQEVIVSDQLVKTKYQEGDTATVLVMKHRNPSEKPGPDLLSFAVLPLDR